MKHPLPWLRTLLQAVPRLICFLVLNALLGGAAQAQVCIQDDRGQTICLPRPASRIITLYAAFDEILTDLGQAGRIRAHTSGNEPLAAIADKPVIGTHLQPNAESIVSLSPDLIVQMGGRAEALEAVHFLEKCGLTTAVFHLESFAQLFSVMERLGTLTASSDQAALRIQTMQAGLDEIAQTSGTRPRIFFEARYPNLLAAGQKSIVSEIIDHAGGQNCVTAPNKLIRLGQEELLRLDPDIYLIQRGPMNPSPRPLAKRPLFQSLTCLRTGHIFTVDQNIFSRPGPRTLQAVRQLAAIIQAWRAQGATKP